MPIYTIPASEFVGHLPSPDVDIVIRESHLSPDNNVHEFHIFCSFRALITLQRRVGRNSFILHCRVWYHGHHSAINEFSPAIEHRLYLSEAQARSPRLTLDCVSQNLCDTYLGITTPVDTSSSEEE